MASRTILNRTKLPKNLYILPPTPNPLDDEYNKNNAYISYIDEIDFKAKNSQVVYVLELIANNLRKRNAYINRQREELEKLLQSEGLDHISSTLIEHGLMFELKKTDPDHKPSLSDLIISNIKGPKNDLKPILYYYQPPQEVLNILSEKEINLPNGFINKNILDERLHFTIDPSPEDQSLFNQYYRMPLEIVDPSDAKEEKKDKLKSLRRKLDKLLEIEHSLYGRQSDPHYSLLLEDLNKTERYLRSAIISAEFLVESVSSLGASRENPNVLRQSHMIEVISPEAIEKSPNFYAATIPQKQVLYDSQNDILVSRISLEPVDNDNLEAGERLKVREELEQVQPNKEFIFALKNGKLYILPQDSIEVFHHLNILPGKSIDSGGVVEFNEKGKIKSINVDTGHYKSSIIYHLYPAIIQLPSEFFSDDAIVSNLPKSAENYKEVPYKDFISGKYLDPDFWNEREFTKEELQKYHEIELKKLRPPLMNRKNIT